MSTFTNRIAGAIATVALGGIVLAPTAANAEGVTVNDGADVAGSLTDIHTVKAWHGSDRVRVTVNFADLRRHSAATAGAAIFLDTRPARTGPEFVLYSGLEEGTDYQLVRMRDWRTVGEPLGCAHNVTLNYVKDNLAFSAVRGCVGNPTRVRVGVRMVDSTDGSHVIRDWMKGPRQFSRWLAVG